MRRATRRRASGAAGATALLLAACALAAQGAGVLGQDQPQNGGGGHTASTSSSPARSAAVAPGTAAAQLRTLPVKGRAPATGYDEGESFGQRWSDDVPVSGGHDGCDTRNDVLRRDLDPVTVEPGTQGCVAESGTLSDPYSGQQIDFTRGRGTSDDVPVDHVVAKANAWVTGAQQLDEDERRAFANDPLNLQGTGQRLNSQKGDSDAATWLPPSKSYRCTYVARQIGIKAKYRLWVTAPERDAMQRVLSGCPKEPAARDREWTPPSPKRGARS